MRNKATSNIKRQQVLSSIGLDNVGIYLRDGPFSTDIGIVLLHWSKGTPYGLLKSENFFDSNGCAPPQKLSRFTLKRDGPCLFSEYNIKGLVSKRDSYCAR